MPATAGGEPSAEVPLLLRDLSFELGRMSHLFARRHGLHATDVDALGRLHQAELDGTAMTPTALAASIDLSAPATSALLRRLEGVGHVERRVDPDDGRQHLIGLQASARDVAREFFGPVAGAIRRSMEGLVPAEIEVVEHWLQAMVAAARQVAEQLSDEAGPPEDGATAG